MPASECLSIPPNEGDGRRGRDHVNADVRSQGGRLDCPMTYLGRFRRFGRRDPATAILDREATFKLGHRRVWEVRCVSDRRVRRAPPRGIAAARTGRDPRRAAHADRRAVPVVRRRRRLPPPAEGGALTGSALAVIRHAAWKAAISTAADLRATLAAGAVGAS